MFICIVYFVFLSGDFLDVIYKWSNKSLLRYVLAHVMVLHGELSGEFLNIIKQNLESVAIVLFVYAVLCKSIS